MNEMHLTYNKEINGILNVIDSKTFQMRYSVNSETGKTTNISILLDPENMDMITFDYQELKEILGDNKEQVYEKLLRSILWELQTYQEKGGSYVIPVEILNDFLTEIEEVLPNE